MSQNRSPVFKITDGPNELDFFMALARGYEIRFGAEIIVNFQMLRFTIGVTLLGISESPDDVSRKKWCFTGIVTDLQNNIYFPVSRQVKGSFSYQNRKGCIELAN